MRKETEKGSILLIEDRAEVATALQNMMEQEQYEVQTASTAIEGLGRAQTADVDVVVTDLQLPPDDGLEVSNNSGLRVIETLRHVRPQLPIILMTAHHSTDAAIEATRLGAYDYILKPINPEEFLALIEKAVGACSETGKAKIESRQESEPHTIIGRSRAMQKVYKEIGRIASRPVTILIRGETGTGKELVARALHRFGDRANQPFVIVNCVAIAETLLESELFGHERGAFTGAQTQRA